MIRERLKRFKPLLWLYNAVNSGKLSHNKEAYAKYGLQKPLFSSISSKDFPDKTSKAWLDTGDSAELLKNDPRLENFPEAVKQGLLDWSANGFLIWENFFTEQQVDALNQEVDLIVNSGRVSFTHDNKLPFLNKVSPLVDTASKEPRLLDILGIILDREVVPFQTLNFVRGSGQRAHSDSIHMTTYPLGYLIAAWIALEDVTAESGPLFYYPGSHKLPYLLNDDFGNISNTWMLGDRNYSDYEDVMEDLIRKSGLKPLAFLPKKGDLLLWHANLIHGGMPITDPKSTRRSMVVHYFAKDVIKYHEITERPTLM
jgi:hypothetical protein